MDRCLQDLELGTSMKNMKSIAAGAFAGIIISIALPLTASANIIDTTYGAGAGSFELGAHSGNAFDGLAVGSTTITGWTVGGPGDGIDWLNEPSFNASAGVRSIDLQSNFASSISTVISTVIGQTYKLTFDSAAVSPLQQSGTVSAGSLIGQAFAPAYSAAGTFATQVYEAFSFEFEALATSTTVSFFSDGTCCTGATYGPVIDNVSVVEATAVSGPNALAIFGLGLASLGLARRRKAA